MLHTEATVDTEGKIQDHSTFSQRLQWFVKQKVTQGSAALPERKHQFIPDTCQHLILINPISPTQLLVQIRYAYGLEPLQQGITALFKIG